MGLFGGMVEGYNKVKGRKDQNFNDQFERAKSMVAMQEAGYSFDPKTNTLSRSDQFGQVPAGFVRVGGKAVQDPTYVNQKDQLDIEEKKWKKEQRDKFGAGPSFGSPSSGQGISPASNGQPASFGGGSGDYWYNPINDKLEETPDFKLRQKKLEDEQKPLSDTSATRMSAANQSLGNINRVREMATPEQFGKMKAGFSKIRIANKLGVTNPESVMGNALNAASFGLAKIPFKTSDDQKEFENNISTLVEGQLRARTGAAAPQSEVDREVARILASDDSLKSFLSKISNAEKFNKGVMEGIRPGSSQQTPQKSYNSPEEADANEAPGTVVMVQGRKYQV